MIRRTARRVSRLKLSRAKATALIILLIAAFIEVYMHVSHYSIVVPSHDLDAPFYTSCQEPPNPNNTTRPRASAALVMLVRNKELDGALKTVASVERKFNRWFRYPIVFLNDEPWTDEFKDAMTAAVSGEARFEVIPPAEWTFPEWMDREAARAAIKSQGQWMIKFAGLETYHHMCRFYSGKFYSLEALREYKWYWRIEPDVEFYCDITYDPFLEMEKRGKVYGHTIAVPEGPRTCPSLFRRVSDWKEARGIESTELWKTMVSPSWVPWPLRSMLGFMNWHRDANGDAWSLCHYWSNFEIASLEFFRGKEYQQLFEYLDSTGGFYHERWGDAPVHSLAVGMLLDAGKVHHFEDLGYRHDYWYQCPANAVGGQLLESKTLNSPYDSEREGGIGCRCECDGSKTRNWPGYCLSKLKAPTKTKQTSLWGRPFLWFLGTRFF